MDVWGAYSSPTYDGCRYFLTIVDDYTRCTWVFLMRHKNQSISFLQQLHNYIENHFHISIKFLRTDNAKELCDGEALNWYHTKCIKHQTNYVQTPQKNGVVERKHRHLLETARALPFQANLPSKFWGDCILCYPSPAYIISPLMKNFSISNQIIII